MAGHPIRATGAQNRRGHRGHHGHGDGELGNTSTFLILILSVVAVTSVVWQLLTLMDGGISEAVSIADLTGFASAAVTGVPFLDLILWQVLSLHIGLIALIAIVLVLATDKMFRGVARRGYR